MALVAVIAWLVYLCLAFGYRSLAQRRATGRSGFVGFSAGHARVERAAGGLFAAALVLGFAAPVAGLVRPGAVLSGALFASRAALVAGGCLFLLGLTMTLVAQFAMGPSWRIGVDPREHTELVVAGPFRIVRNPIFSAMAVAGTGLYFLFPSLLASSALLALLVALELQVRCVEEPYLLRTHGQAYLRYAQATGRFVPGLGLLRAPYGDTPAG